MLSIGLLLKIVTSRKGCLLRPVNTEGRTHYHAKKSLNIADLNALRLVNQEGKPHDHVKISRINLHLVEKYFAETGEPGGQNA